MDLRSFVNKQFIASERGQEVMAVVLEKDMSTAKKCQEILSLLQLPSTISHEQLEQAYKVVENQLAAFNVLDQNLKNTLKKIEDDEQLEAHYRKVRRMTSQYAQLCTFLEQVMQGFKNNELVDYERVQEFQGYYRSLLTEKQELEDWLHEFYDLDPIDDTQAYNSRVGQLEKKKRRLKQLQQRHLPKVKQILHQLSRRLQHVRNPVFTILEKFDINYDATQAISFYFPGEGTEREGDPDQESVSYTEKPKDDIISAFFVFLRDHGVDLQSLEVIPCADSPSLYVYLPSHQMTVVISNVYGHATHIYPTEVSPQEIQEETIKSLKERYEGVHLYFNEVTRMEGWLERLAEKLEQLSSQKLAVLQEQPSSNQEVTRETNKESSTLEAMITTFHEETIDEQERKILQQWILRTHHHNFSLTALEDVEVGATYEGYVSGWDEKKVYVVIGGSIDKNVFGHIMKRSVPLEWYDAADIKKFKPLTVRVRKIYPTTGHIELEPEDLHEGVADLDRQQIEQQILEKIDPLTQQEDVSFTGQEQELMSRYGLTEHVTKLLTEEMSIRERLQLFSRIQEALR